MARPRKPTKLKLLKGTAQKCRMNPKEPKPARGIPSPPPHLSDRAKTAWGYVGGLLDRMGIVTEGDALGLEGLCQCYSELVEAREALRERGATTYESVNGGGGTMYRAYPEVALVADADRRFRGWLQAFGLTPADRSRVSASEKEDSNPFAEFGT